MLYAALLPGAAGGVIEPRHVVVPLREVLKSTNLRAGYVTGRDPQHRRVTVRSADLRAAELPYDQLVVALGSTSRTFPIPGLKEHALGFKTLSEGIALRNRLAEALELAETADDDEKRRELLTYVVVGAGYAGLEDLAELQDFAREVLHPYPRCRLYGLRFMLVEARDRVMLETDRPVAEFAISELPRRGIEIQTNTTVERVARTQSNSRAVTSFLRGPCPGPQGSSRTRSSGSWDFRFDGGERMTSTARWRASKTCGRSATRQPCLIRRARASPVRRRPSTPSAKRALSRATLNSRSHLPPRDDAGARAPGPPHDGLERRRGARARLLRAGPARPPPRA